MKLLLDEDLSPAIAIRLRKLGLDAESVHELGRQGLSDREQLRRAALAGRCFVTRNRNDYVLLTREFFSRGEAHAGVLVVPWTLRPDDFRGLASAVAAYAKRYGGGSTEYLFDFVPHRHP